MNNKVTQEPTYIHSLCRTNTNNNTWANWTSDAHVKKVRAKSIASENFNFSIRSTEKNFNFKKHCFYCTKVCEYDDKHPGQNKFEYVQTMDSGILKTTLTQWTHIRPFTIVPTSKLHVESLWKLHRFWKANPCGNYDIDSTFKIDEISMSSPRRFFYVVSTIDVTSVVAVSILSFPDILCSRNLF